jgi:PelA/Pel-15E family pectate lyase
MNKLIGFSISILSIFIQCKTTAQAPKITTTNSTIEIDTIAEKMVIYQRNIGGWAKALDNVKIDYKKPLSEGDRAGVIDDANRNDATIDNSATTREIRYLLTAYKKTLNVKYLKSAEKGIHFLLEMQYANGGFPQFYPDTSGYRKHITFNDNAMINALEVLKNVADGKKDGELVDKSLVEPSKKAVEKGVNCILNLQVKINGKLTVWCAQHDLNSFKPTKARAYELPSLSGQETVGILAFLMSIDNPLEAIKTSIKSGVEWLELNKIKGYKYEDIVAKKEKSGKDRVITADANSTIWARFYDLETGKPYFCGRDGIKKATVAEIENERRTGYAWYGTWAANLLEKQYPKWLEKWGK